MRGFSLIELMITVAIASILMAIAAPSFLYHHSTVELRQALTDLHGIEADMATMTGPCAGVTASLDTLPQYDYRLNTSTMCSVPARFYTDGAPVGQYISAASLNGLVLTATIASSAAGPIAGKTLTVTATQGANGLLWSCSFPGFPIYTCP